MVPLGVSFSLQIKDQGLVEFDLSANLDPFDFNQLMLCLGYVILSTVVPCTLPPVSFLQVKGSVS